MALIRNMTSEDLAGVVELQKSAFPPPFPQDYHWDPHHLQQHIDIFPDGQFVAELEGRIVGSCSNTIISEERWRAHENWYLTVGGPAIRGFTRKGTTLYGLDIAVEPSVRRQGIGRAFYEARYALIRSLGLTRYGTGCRIPGFSQYHRLHPEVDVHRYGALVAVREVTDRTMTPLLHMRLTFLEIIEEYMEDEESANAGALLEWVAEK